MSDQNRSASDLVAEANATLELVGRFPGQPQNHRVAVALGQYAECLFSRIESELLRDPEIRNLCAAQYVKIEPDKEKPDSLYDVSVRDRAGRFFECGKAAFMYGGYEVELQINEKLHDFRSNNTDEIKAQVIDLLFPLIPTNAGHGLPQDVNSS